MLHKRLISGLLFLPFFYLVTWVLPPLYFAALVILAAAVGQYEFYRMARMHGTSPLVALGIAIGVLILLEAYQPLPAGIGNVLLVACVLLIMIARLFSRRPVEGAFDDIASTLLGVLYVAMLFAFQILVRVGTEGKQWVVFLFFVIWASDIGAYVIGMLFGKHRLYEKVSPKKSVEGLLGGLAAAVGMALLCRIWFIPFIGLMEAMGIALLLALAGVVGDLVESLLKRAAGVKDSGGLIPGHGGVLDRMDSMLFAAPMLYYYLIMR